MRRFLARSALILCSLAIATIAAADVTRVLARIPIAAGETTSTPAQIGSAGMIRAAVVRSEIPFTLTAASVISPTDAVDLYTETKSTTGTLTLANFVNKPIADTTLLTVTVADPPDEDTTLVVILFVER
jgi:hypothetical protein